MLYQTEKQSSQMLGTSLIQNNLSFNLPRNDDLMLQIPLSADFVSEHGDAIFFYHTMNN